MHASSTIDAVAECDAALRPRGDVGLMGDEDHGDAACVQLLEQCDDLLGGTAVERAGRLVGEEDMRVVDERARDRHALLLAAGQLRRLVPGALGEPHARQALLRLLPRVALVRAMRIEERQRDVVERAWCARAG